LRADGVEAGMEDPIDINRRSWDERATIHERDTLGGRMLARFRAGEDTLHMIEAAELGDVSGNASSTCNATLGATRSVLCAAAP
jgi:hypothetical protein